MPRIADPTVEAWLFLLHAGGAWAAREVAAATGQEPEEVANRLLKLEESGRLQRAPTVPGVRQKRYMVTGTCLVPQGLHVGEVQE